MAQVRVIDQHGGQLGIMTPSQAIAMAKEREADLVEIVPTAVPPVCKIINFGKFKYEQNKKQQKAKKKQHVTHLKEVKLRPKIEDHDYDFKVEHGRKFLEQHDKVKFTVTFRGREMAHSEMGYRLLDRVVKDLEGIGQVEIPPRMEGKSLTLLMVPRSVAAKPVLTKPQTSAASGPRSAAPKS